LAKIHNPYIAQTRELLFSHLIVQLHVKKRSVS